MALLLLVVGFSFISPISAGSPVTAAGRWLVDDDGRVRLYHGFNSVLKGRPYYDPQILNATRLKLYREWGFNVVRLGAMWTGAEPLRQGQFNETYIGTLEKIVSQLRSYGLDVILDMHQDVISSAFHSYDGVPRWLIDRLPPAKHRYPWPFIDHIPAHQWAMGYFTEAVSVAFQQLYDNVAGACDAMAQFWTKIASVFKHHDNVLGYELINEPWAGDIYSELSLLLPGVAGRRNLQPFYHHIADAIHSVDNRTLIFYEPVTWAIYGSSEDAGTGFSTVPGGLDYRNCSVLSYHYYCWLAAGGDKHQEYPLWKRVICDDVLGPRVMPSILTDISRLGGSAFLTEFGICSPDGRAGSVDTVECEFVMRQADVYLQSWTYWDSGFFNDSQPQGINWSVVQAFARVYARAVSGVPVYMNFDPEHGQFRLKWLQSAAIRQPTEVFIPVPLHYPHGFQVFHSAGLRWSFNKTTSLLSVYNVNITSATSVYLNILPSEQLPVSATDGAL